TTVRGKDLRSQEPERDGCLRSLATCEILETSEVWQRTNTVTSRSGDAPAFVQGGKNASVCESGSAAYRPPQPPLFPRVEARNVPPAGVELAGLLIMRLPGCCIRGRPMPTSPVKQDG